MYIGACVKPSTVSHSHHTQACVTDSADIAAKQTIAHRMRETKHCESLGERASLCH